MRSKYWLCPIRPKNATIEPKIISTEGIGRRNAFATKGLPHINSESISMSVILVCITAYSYLIA